MLEIIGNSKLAYKKTGIENDTIFKDLPGSYAKLFSKPLKRGRNRRRPILGRTWEWIVVDIKKQLYVTYSPGQDPLVVLEGAIRRHDDGTAFILIPDTLCQRWQLESAHHFTHHLRA